VGRSLAVPEESEEAVRDQAEIDGCHEGDEKKQETRHACIFVSPPVGYIRASNAFRLGDFPIASSE
jgi:hypothetical protein